MSDIQKTIYGLRIARDDLYKLATGGHENFETEAITAAISALRELQQYRQIGTLRQCDGYKNHSQRISKMCNCNDCGRRRDCKIAPRLGDDCRINCYFWEEGKR